MSRFRARTHVKAPIGRWAVVAHDLVAIALAWLGAYWLRFNMGYVPHVFWRQGLRLLPVILVVQGLVFWSMGLYRGLWRFASVPDLLRIFKAIVAGTVASAFILFLGERLEFVPRSAFVLDGMLLTLLLGGPRFFYRFFKDRGLYQASGKKALIAGAGRAGEMLVRDLLRDSGVGFRPVAFVDDNPRRIGQEIHGVPVVADCGQLPQVAARLEVDIVFIAVTEAKASHMRRLVELCERSGRPFRILPGLQSLVDGQVTVRELREVRIEDLLGREPVLLYQDEIASGIGGKAVLVSGAGGSIGSELCRQIARLGPRRLILLEHSEFNLYNIELELRRDYPHLALLPVLGDVRDAVLVDRVLGRERPDIIFHAAAYKHVPMLEGQGRAAVLNNVFGTETLAAAADRHGCGVFLLISTDKAVNPSNIMGATKRAAEILCQQMNGHSRTRFLTVRFGNVLGSAGSVIPLFKAQIASGGPVTVTHRDITRYFMTIPEACGLILQSSVIGKGGEIFVLDMGEPVRIGYLAEQLILLSGKRPGQDIEIVYSGLRPGEKLYEELFYADEALLATTHPKIRVTPGTCADPTRFVQGLERLRLLCARDDEQELAEALRDTIGCAQPSSGESARLATSS
ncbi:nucleoside-diphosphate sugar epimerase/dehydratase [Acidiferrobacter sp.]|jgi:FlaA1/EpsC-like NDP-sugar epimerase|uniref:polysaccharide biosynthesis protein n=1 Tax=Acidiferrobacter sp. TaxID=1872107 RepID=UPI00263A08F2|nr:nucleoside-diphosphate sugar epimerase/dehydratase [Acidiferrobacter sp.]